MTYIIVYPEKESHGVVFFFSFYSRNSIQSGTLSAAIWLVIPCNVRFNFRRRKVNVIDICQKQSYSVAGNKVVSSCIERSG